MSTDEILQGLAEIANEIHGSDPADVTMDKTFAGDLGVDSIEMAEIVFAAEDRFGVTIPEDESKNLKTVGDAVRYIEAHAA